MNIFNLPTWSILWKRLPLPYLYAQVRTTPFMCTITPCVCSVGNTLQKMLFVVKPLRSYSSLSLTPCLFPICTNLEMIQTYLTLSITKQLRGAFLKIHNICSLFFSLVWRGRGCSSTGFFLRHASHGRLRPESLVLHQPVDVMLGTVVTSWHLKNICYAQQGLLCVPVCHNLDRKGEEAEMATAVPLLTYSNTFNIEQNASNRQRTEKHRKDTQLGHHNPHSTCSHTQAKHFHSIRTTMKWRDREVKRVHYGEKKAVTKQWPHKWQQAH